MFFYKFFYIKTFPLVFTKLPWEKLDVDASAFYLSIYLFIYLFIFECLGIQFFNSLTCDLRDTMPRQRSLTRLPREAENFPRGDRHLPNLLIIKRVVCAGSIEALRLSSYEV